MSAERRKQLQQAVALARLEGKMVVLSPDELQQYLDALDVLDEIAVDVVLADDLSADAQVAALWGVVRRHTQIAQTSLGSGETGAQPHGADAEPFQHGTRVTSGLTTHTEETTQ